MKLKARSPVGETESLGEYCVRSFSHEEGTAESASIFLYSGVPVLESGGKKRAKTRTGFAMTRGKVIT